MVKIYELYELKIFFRHNGNVFIYLFIYSNIFIQGVYIFAKMLFKKNMCPVIHSIQYISKISDILNGIYTD